MDINVLDPILSTTVFSSFDISQQSTNLDSGLSHEEIRINTVTNFQLTVIVCYFTTWRYLFITF